MNVFFRSAAIVFAVIGLFSCEKPDISHISNESKRDVRDTIEFRGEVVVVPGDFSKAFLNQTGEDFDAYYSAQSQYANLRTSAGGDLLTREEMLTILGPLARKYPDLSWDKDISESDLQRIRNDFPKIASREEVRDKSDVILAFYNAIFKPEAVAAVIAYVSNMDLCQHIVGNWSQPNYALQISYPRPNEKLG